MAQPRYDDDWNHEDWFAPEQGFKWACCDCDLVHRVYTRVVDTAQGRQVQMKIVGDARCTAALRRETKKRKERRK